MHRLFLTVTVAVLAAAVAYQQVAIRDLSGRMGDAQAQIESLQQVRADKDAAIALLRRVALVNFRKIQNLRRKQTVTLTAYSPRAKETDASPYQTATNRQVRHGIVAVSRDLFDMGWVFGKKVYIKGHGVFTIDDLMAKEKQTQIDIFMFDTQEALRFGKQQAEAYLLDLEPLPKTAQNVSLVD